MALPFILGVAVGAGAVIAYNNSKKIQEKTSEVLDKSKDMASDVKKNMDATVECIKDKVEKKCSKDNTDEKNDKEQEF